MRGGDLVDPALELAVVQLEHAVAGGADEVVVVRLGAEPIAELTGPVRERVDEALLAEDRKRPVDGGEPDRDPRIDETPVNLLCSCVVALGRERLEHAKALGGHAHALARDPLSQPELRCVAHPHTLAVVLTRMVLILLAAALLAGCASRSGGDGRIDVAASFYPLAYAAEQIGGRRVGVDNLTPPGAEPHDLEVSPRDVQRIRDADVVLLLGGGFQPQLEDAAGTGKRVLRVLEIPGLEPFPNRDPHVWLDPVRFSLVAERVGRALGRPARAHALARRLRRLDAQYRRGLERCARRDLVTSHDAFAYLAARYHLHAIPITGLSPEAEPSPRALERVVRLVRATGTTTVYTEPLASSRIAATIARETGARTAVLNPIEGLTSEEQSRGEDYFSLMRANLAALRAGLECR